MKNKLAKWFIISENWVYDNIQIRNIEEAKEMEVINTNFPLYKFLKIRWSTETILYLIDTKTKELIDWSRPKSQ